MKESEMFLWLVDCCLFLPCLNSAFSGHIGTGRAAPALLRFFFIVFFLLSFLVSPSLLVFGSSAHLGWKALGRRWVLNWAQVLGMLDSLWYGFHHLERSTEDFLTSSIWKFYPGHHCCHGGNSSLTIGTECCKSPSGNFRNKDFLPHRPFITWVSPTKAIGLTCTKKEFWLMQNDDLHGDSIQVWTLKSQTDEVWISFRCLSKTHQDPNPLQFTQH